MTAVSYCDSNACIFYMAGNECVADEIELEGGECITRDAFYVSVVCERCLPKAEQPQESEQ